MEITYRKVGDYLLPELILHENPDDVQPLGRYARMHRAHLREHRPALYAELLLTERLYPLLREIDEAAENRRQAGMPESAILSELVFEAESL